MTIFELLFQVGVVQRELGGRCAEAAAAGTVKVLRCGI